MSKRGLGALRHEKVGHMITGSIATFCEVMCKLDLDTRKRSQWPRKLSVGLVSPYVSKYGWWSINPFCAKKETEGVFIIHQRRGRQNLTSTIVLGGSANESKWGPCF